MASDIPKWLTKEFIQHALQGGTDVPENETVTVDSLEVDKPIAKGENYMCEILRAKTAYKEFGKEPSTTSLIIKSPLQGCIFTKNLDILEKEVKIYNEYLPKMNRLLGDNKITPKSFYSSEKNVVVLEDLKAKGYTMADRRRQLDYDHCVTALTALAVFHAASVKMHEEDSELVEAVGKEIFFHKDLKKMNEGFAKMSFALMADQCKKLPELNRYKEQLLGYSENSWDFITELVKPKDNSINVLNHGDYWVNNMMFRYENDKPVDLKIIDMQVSRYTWPAIDLMYFFYSSVQEEVRTLRKDDLLNVYLKELNSNLEKFGVSQRLTDSELKQMMEASEFFGILVTLTLYPIVISDPKDGVLDFTEVTLESLKDFENNPFRPLYEGKIFLETIPKRFADFEKTGWF